MHPQYTACTHADCMLYNKIIMKDKSMNYAPDRYYMIQIYISLPRRQKQNFNITGEGPLPKIGTLGVHVGSLSVVNQDNPNYNCTFLSVVTLLKTRDRNFAVWRCSNPGELQCFFMYSMQKEFIKQVRASLHSLHKIYRE